MGLSIFFARFLGFYLVIAGLFYILRRQSIKSLSKDFFINNGVVRLSGLVNLFLGLAVVLSHNVWEPTWRTLITIIGFLILLSALVRLFTPVEKLQNWWTKFAEGHGPLILGIIALIVGLFLLYKGYFGWTYF